MHGAPGLQCGTTATGGIRTSPPNRSGDCCRTTRDPRNLAWTMYVTLTDGNLARCENSHRCGRNGSSATEGAGSTIQLLVLPERVATKTSLRQSPSGRARYDEHALTICSHFLVEAKMRTCGTRFLQRLAWPRRDASETEQSCSWSAYHRALRVASPRPVKSSRTSHHPILDEPLLAVCVP